MRCVRRQIFWHDNAGFSLLEFLVAITLLGIITAMAIGGVQHLRARIQMNANINNLLHTIYEARSRALVSGNEVVICPSRTSLRCDTSSQWQNGWLAFQTGVAGRRQPGTGDRTLASGERMPGLQVTANRRVFVLRPFGRRSTNGTWVFCDRHARTRAQALVISYTGKPRVTQTDADGDPLRCPLA